METFSLTRGQTPLLISLPHNGTHLPDDIAERMRPHARRVPDTDWHVAELYQPLADELGASVIRPVASRYVIDLNRPADGHALYPGRQETGVAPVIGFDGVPLYRDGEEPSELEVQQRIQHWWRPYHQALADELQRLHAEHGRVLLWDGHSIRSRVPMLFDGRLPDFNIGTADDASCRPELSLRLKTVMQAQTQYTHVLNGRFKGGFITRHYGRPDQGIDAVQLELAQCQYMDESSFEWDAQKAAQVQKTIRDLLRAAII